MNSVEEQPINVDGQKILSTHLGVFSIGKIASKENSPMQIKPIIPISGWKITDIMRYVTNDTTAMIAKAGDGLCIASMKKIFTRNKANSTIRSIRKRIPPLKF